MTDNRVIGEKAIAATGVLLAVLMFVNASMRQNWLLVEPDLWWHVKTGLTTIANKAVPQTDLFSYTHEGKPWIAKEWLSQVIYAAAYTAAGWAGPLVIAAASIGATAWLMFRTAARHLRPQLALVLVVFAIAAVKGVTTARPHLLTFPIVVFLAVHFFDKARALKSPAWWTIALFTLWANLHASFPIGFALCGCAFLDYLHRSWFADPKTAAKWIAYMALAAVATLINPYFIKPYFIALDMAKGISVMSQIIEWQPLTVDTNKLLELGFLAIFLALMWLRPRLWIGQILLTLLFFHMMLLHQRFLYLFFLLVPILLLPEVVAMVPRLSADAWLDSERDGLQRLLGTKFNRVIAVACVLSLGVVAYLAMPGHVEVPESTSISKAIAYVEANRASRPALQKRVINTYNFGGPLILHGIKTYVDGRAEQLFLGDFIEQYAASGAGDGEPIFAKMLADDKVGWTIFEPKDRHNEFLSHMPGWEKTYADDNAVIYERRS